MQLLFNDPLVHWFIELSINPSLPLFLNELICLRKSGMEAKNKNKTYFVLCSLKKKKKAEKKGWVCVRVSCILYASVFHGSLF